MWKSATQSSPLRYSRLIQTGFGSRRAIAAMYACGNSHANASITTSAMASVSPACDGSCQCSIVTPIAS